MPDGGMQPPEKPTIMRRASETRLSYIPELKIAPSRESPERRDFSAKDLAGLEGFEPSG